MFTSKANIELESKYFCFNVSLFQAWSLYLSYISRELVIAGLVALAGIATLLALSVIAGISVLAA